MEQEDDFGICKNCNCLVEKRKYMGKLRVVHSNPYRPTQKQYALKCDCGCCKPIIHPFLVEVKENEEPKDSKRKL